MCEVPLNALIFLLSRCGLADAISRKQISSNSMLQQCCAVMAQRFEAERSGFT
jgi:hypothetical protein